MSRLNFSSRKVSNAVSSLPLNSDLLSKSLEANCKKRMSFLLSINEISRARNISSFDPGTSR